MSGRGDLTPPHADPGTLPVVGGQPAPEGTWPEVAAIFTPDHFACTGVLIAPDAVLTAAHCAWNVESVVLGTADHGSGGTSLGVLDVTLHPDPYDTFDVAVLHLEADSDIPPARLPPDCVVASFLYPQAPVVVLGFGAVDEAGLTWTTLLHEGHTAVTEPACADAERGCNEAVFPDGELIAGGDGVDSCSGDSGGPLYLAEPPDRWLIGVTSRAARPSTRACGDGGIYTRIDAIRPWLEATVGRALAPEGCDGFNLPPTLVAPPVRVRPGGTTTVTLRISDPDPDDTHQLALLSDPSAGRAVLHPDGRLTYTAGPWTGSDAFRVGVTDDGEPPLGAETVVEVAIAWPPSEPRGCGHLPHGVGLLWLPALLALRRRPCGG